MSAACSPSQTFYDAAGYLASAPSLSKLSSKIKLELYGLYKYLTVSPQPNVGRPPLFDIPGRAKWDAWNSTHNTYGDRYGEAENRYLDVARQLGWTEGHASTLDDAEIGDFDDDDDGGGLWGIGNAVSSVQQVPRTDQEESITIHGLALANDVDGLTSFLQEMPNTDLNKCDEFGYTPLHLAADRGCAAVVELLLKRGADPSLKDPDDLTALELAQVAGHEDVQKLLGETAVKTFES